MKKAFLFQKNGNFNLLKRNDENTWGETVIKILIYLKFLSQIFVSSVNMQH